MNSKITFFPLLAMLCMVGHSIFAAEKLSDAALRQKIIGAWTGPRWAVEYKADGIKYPISTESLTAHWEVKGGVYYEEFQPHQMLPCDIITLTDKSFVYRYRGGEVVNYKRLTKKEADLRRVR